MRVYELARELKVTNNQIKVACGALDNPVKSHMTEIDEEFAEQVKEYILNADPEDMEPKEKKEMSKPWVDKPWSTDMLRVAKKHSGFRAHWVSPDKVQKRLEQGYTYAQKKDYGELTDKLPGEESNVDTYVRRREMILMEIPEEKAKDRDNFIDWKSNKRAKDARKMAESQARQLERGLEGSTDFITSSQTSKGY